MQKTSFKYYINEDGRRTSSKTGLYPMGYGGIGLYPDADYITHSADAILYLTMDKRLYHNGDEAPFCITHLPGHTQYGDKVNNGEKEPFNIQKISGKSIKPQNHKMPGKSISFKNFVRLNDDPQEICPPDSPNLPK